MLDSKWLSHWLPPILWTLQIFYLSLLPRGSYPKIEDQHFDPSYLQYVYHFGQFLCLSLLFYRAMLYSSFSGEKVGTRHNHAYLTLAVVIIIAFLDEIIQIPVPTRRFTLRDLMADVVGGGFGLLFMRIRSTSNKPSRSPRGISEG
jgi:VanZ family protein